ncbi:MAG: insulinase family protein [Hyphomicrobiaceae bacterium]|nr:insulinase family protein [Hyphomicrobiaceae bacterium]
MPTLPLTRLTFASPSVLALWMTAIMTLAATLPAPIAAYADTRASTFTLSNGMRGVVIPDHRAPVVTHMVWYNAGAADEPPGVSGIAHFLEHLMFKASETIPSGEFSKRIARMGGQDNAFTSQDVTAYYQRIAKDRLAIVMGMEAERMTKLKLDPKEIVTERDVILEERRTRTENNPRVLLSEQMDAALYLSHPYRTPVIGWMHEMERLSHADALTFYKRFYAPNNAILVVSGDVTADEVKALAEKTYGQIPANKDVRPYSRPREPVQRAARRLTYHDERAGKPIVSRYYLAPSYTTAAPKEAESLDLLMKIAAYGTTSRLYKELVVKRKIASSASGWYSGSTRDYGKIAVTAVPAEGVSLEKLEAAIDEVLADLIKNGVTQAELDRARNVYIATYIYESDSQSTLARRYGYGLTVGQTVEQIENWPKILRSLTLDDLKAATKHLDIRASVTGYLIPEAAKPVAGSTGAPAKRG